MRTLFVLFVVYPSIIMAWVYITFNVLVPQFEFPGFPIVIGYFGAILSTYFITKIMITDKGDAYG